MTQDFVESEAPFSSTNKGIGRRLDAAGWGLFFVWVGLNELAHAEMGANGCH